MKPNVVDAVEAAKIYEYFMMMLGKRILWMKHVRGDDNR